MFYKLLVHSAS